jgi:hypothetical protein
MMAETIDLGDGWIADRGPWEDLVRLVERLFADPLGDDGDEAELRADILSVLKQGAAAYRVGQDWGLGAEELMKLKQCDEAAVGCNIRSEARS